MSGTMADPARTALVLVDLQNDFLHPEGAYARGGATAPEIAALPARLKPVVDAARQAGCAIVSTHFTLVAGRDGEPLIADHLKRLRPFLRKGDFLPGSFGHRLVDALAPADFMIEKVAYSAFYQSRLEFVLRKAGLDTLVFAGIVTNGGVMATVQDAALREFRCVVIADGCAAFSDAMHAASLNVLGGIARLTCCREFAAELAAFAAPPG